MCDYTKAPSWKGGTFFFTWPCITKVSYWLAVMVVCDLFVCCFIKFFLHLEVTHVSTTFTLLCLNIIKTIVWFSMVLTEVFFLLRRIFNEWGGGVEDLFVVFHSFDF